METAYRIKILELKNGTRKYIPQVGYRDSHRNIFNKFTRKWMSMESQYDWYNIIEDTIYSYRESRTQTISWLTEEEALKCISGHQILQHTKTGEETHSISYKDIVFPK